ncbi:MAG: S41 family peptidase [Patescibacteria group bacterium]
MIIKLKTARNLIIILIFGLLTGGIGYRLGTNGVTAQIKDFRPAFTISNRMPQNPPPADFSLFWEVWNKVSAQYVDKTKIDPQKMVWGAISGMVAGIGDPYTVFLPPVANKESKESLNGSFEGIGAQLGIKDQKIIVVAPLAGNPAEAAGLKPGDWIIKVDGQDSLNWTLPETVAKIRGSKGTFVTLNILHSGETKSVDYKIMRDTITIKSVEWKVIDATGSGKVAYLKLSRFGEDTDRDWDTLITEISKTQELKGLVLDLRNNPGGYLQSAVYTASDFLKQGQLVVRQDNNNGTSEDYNVTRLGKLLTIPVVVLINQGSASASEILAGALHDYKRAKLVGEQSFGKGSVQEAQDLSGGAGLHVTISKWLLPSGDWINGKGLTPDVKVENDDKQPDKDLQLEAAIKEVFIK